MVASAAKYDADRDTAFEAARAVEFNAFDKILSFDSSRTRKSIGSHSGCGPVKSFRKFVFDIRSRFINFSKFLKKMAHLSEFPKQCRHVSMYANGSSQVIRLRQIMPDVFDSKE